MINRDTLHHYGNVVRLPMNMQSVVFVALHKLEHLHVCITSSDSTGQLFGRNIPRVQVNSDGEDMDFKASLTNMKSVLQNGDNYRNVALLRRTRYSELMEFEGAKGNVSSFNPKMGPYAEEFYNGK